MHEPARANAIRRDERALPRPHGRTALLGRGVATRLRARRERTERRTRAGKEDRDAPDEIVYVRVDGTGVALRKKHTSKTKGKKGRKGKSKTREVKMAVFFQGGIDSENNPFRMAESTTYVATTDRRKKFEKLTCAELDRRFGRMPKLTIYIGDDGKWVHSVLENEFSAETRIA